MFINFQIPVICFPDARKQDYDYPREVSNPSIRSLQSPNFTRLEIDMNNNLYPALAPELFKEVLLSYRLIFGQTKTSYQEARKYLKAPEIFKSVDSIDPLLQILCCQSSKNGKSGALYNKLEAEDPSHLYSPNIDFPIFGERLLQLQAFIRGQRPPTLNALWNDNRSSAHWWTTRVS